MAAPDHKAPPPRRARKAKPAFEAAPESAETIPAGSGTAPVQSGLSGISGDAAASTQSTVVTLDTAQAPTVAPIPAVTREYVLGQAVELLRRCLQQVEPMRDRRGNQIKDEDGRAIWKFDSAGAGKALDIIGRHIDVGAFQAPQAAVQVSIHANEVTLMDRIAQARLMLAGEAIEANPAPEPLQIARPGEAPPAALDADALVHRIAAARQRLTFSSPAPKDTDHG